MLKLLLTPPLSITITLNLSQSHESSSQVIFKMATDLQVIFHVIVWFDVHVIFL